MAFCRKVKVILKNTQGENSYFFEENPSFSALFIFHFCTLQKWNKMQ